VAEHPHVSVSQMKTFRTCKRKWWTEKYGPFPRRPDTPSHVFGKGLHDAVEQYLKTGAIPADYTYPERIQPAINAGLLPKPRSTGGRLMLEARMDLEDIAPPMLGYVDVLDLEPCYKDGIVEVVDHKSYGNRRYVLSQDQLSTDLQLIPYARWGLLQAAKLGKRTDMVRVSHIRYASPIRGLPPAADKITTVVTAKHVEQQWRDIFVPLAAEMKEVARVAKDMSDTTPNYGGCHAFGGCQFAQACDMLRRAGRTTFQGINTTAPTATPEAKEPTMPTLAELVARRNAGKTTPRTAPKPKTDPGINSPEGASAPVTKTTTKTTTSGGTPLTKSADWNTTSQSDETMKAVADRVVAWMQENQTNTCDEKTSKAIIGEVCDLRRVAKKYHPVVADASAGRLTYHATTNGLRAAADLDFTEDVTPDARNGADVDGPEEAPGEGSVSRPVLVSAKRGGDPTLSSRVLFVDCIPSAPGLDYTRAEMLVARAEGQVADANGGEDPLTMDYAEGKKKVGHALRMLKPTWPIVMSSFNPYAAELRHVLGAQADMVVTGTK